MKLSNNPPFVCAFTGHRVLPYNESDTRCSALKAKLSCIILQILEDNPKTTFISGMALGSDLICAELVLQHRTPSVHLCCVLPCVNHTDKWSKSDKLRCDAILHQSDEIHIMSEHFTKSCIWQRNKFMVDKAHLLVAILSKSVGGTANTVNYAMRENKKIIIINPEV